jgi:predicted enzyme related to lactoylglutathione lyase
MMQRAFTNILSRDVEGTAQFYQQLLGLTRHYDSDWFVILTHPRLPGLEFGILDRTHAIVPTDIAGPPGGVLLTFVVDDVDLVHRTGLDLRADIMQPPTDMPYGQRRLILRDPNGTAVDISAPTH